MNRNLFFRRSLAAITLCLFFQGGLTLAPALAADVAAAPAKAASAPKKVAPAKATKKVATPKAAPESGDALNNKLKTFAHSTIASMNRTYMPSMNKKEVKQNADGSYTCRYIAADGQNLQTSYKKPESSTAVTYIGYMTYDELEYSCTAPSRSEAMAGPFNVTRRETLTELIKYVGGKWTY